MSIVENAKPTKPQRMIDLVPATQVKLLLKEIWLEKKKDKSRGGNSEKRPRTTKPPGYFKQSNFPHANNMTTEILRWEGEEMHYPEERKWLKIM